MISQHKRYLSERAEVLLECAIVLPLVVIGALAMLDVLSFISAQQRHQALATEFLISPQAKSLSIDQSDGQISPISGDNLKVFMDTLGNSFTASPNRGQATVLFALSYLNIEPVDSTSTPPIVAGTVNQANSCRASCCQNSGCGTANVDFYNILFDPQTLNCPAPSGQIWCPMQSIYRYTSTSANVSAIALTSELDELALYTKTTLDKFAAQGANTPIGTRVYALTINGVAEKLYFDQFSILFFRIVEPVGTYILPSRVIAKNFFLIPRKEVGFYDT